jgi:hypothetical protein
MSIVLPTGRESDPIDHQEQSVVEAPDSILSN